MGAAKNIGGTGETVSSGMGEEQESGGVGVKYFLSRQANGMIIDAEKIQRMGERV